MVEPVDEEELERQVKGVYRAVAEAPDGGHHFAIGRPLAEELGYDAADLDRLPAAAVESFAGVGYHFDLADLQPGDDVLDLGSGAGTDVFLAVLRVGDRGSVTGLDMTDRQLEKARRLRDEAGFDNVAFEKGYIETLPFEAERFDAVLSNGVINLSFSKEQAFEEANRVLRPGGRLAISDIVCENPMPESIKTDAELWASCVGGAMPVTDYVDALQAAGFDLATRRENAQYEFLSDRARGACEKYGIKSVTFAARRSGS